MFKEELATVEHYLKTMISLLEAREDYRSNHSLLERTTHLKKELDFVNMTMNKMEDDYIETSNI